MIRITVALVLLVAVWMSVSVLSGGMIHRIVGRELSGRSDSEWALDRLQLAVKLDSRNPDIHALVAKLQPPEESLSTYRLLTQLIPRDGLVWANLFARKLQLGRLDEEARQALDSALKLAPYEPLVQETLIGSASPRWLMLDPATKQKIIEMAVRALESKSHYRKSEIRQLLVNRGLMWPVCASPRVVDHAFCGRYRH
ncbi:MAG: hypothetical protein HOC70_11215 [Gammaproteobacteria bacterium]|jgi:hypothetical protein|nr:hypothetical protein [Gammaproteobacteria bacterium]MBT4493803.1 hypothetical protein [Gammaproteobacteria bacterium]